MAGQHMENLFRRFKGEVVDVKTVSGGIYAAAFRGHERLHLSD